MVEKIELITNSKWVAPKSLFPLVLLMPPPRSAAFSRERRSLMHSKAADENRTETDRLAHISVA
jgi:hypothetical protein